MNRAFYCLILSAGITANSASADIWNLPAPLSDLNTSITFDLDTTWHMVHGRTSRISGRAWLADPRDYSSVRAEISVPVAAFDTERESRDRELREVMHAEQYPQVQFKIAEVKNLCAPGSIEPTHPCEVSIRGDLQIGSITKAIESKAVLSRQDRDYTITGAFPVRWADFGVEDPSILIARVQPVVNVRYTVQLKSNGENHG